MAPVEGVQQPGAGVPQRSLLPGPRGPGPPEATDRGRARERVHLLPGAEQHLLGPKLPEPEPLVHPADAVPEGRATERVPRPAPHGDRPDPDESA